MIDKTLIRGSALRGRNVIHRSTVPIKPEVYDRVFQYFCNSIMRPLFSLPRPIIAGYFPIGSEFDVIPLLQRFYGTNHTTALPVVQEHFDDNESPLVFWEWIPGSATTRGRVHLFITMILIISLPLLVIPRGFIFVNIFLNDDNWIHLRRNGTFSCVTVTPTTCFIHQMIRLCNFLFFLSSSIFLFQFVMRLV